MSLGRLGRIGVLAVCLQGLATPGNAYELRTHREMTIAAYTQTARVVTYLDAVGLKADDKFDPAQVAPPREIDDFQNTGTPQHWLIEGAIREDDYKVLDLLEKAAGCPPPKNRPSQIKRPFNHFYDVQNGGRGLTVLGIIQGLPAPEWALGLQGRGADEEHNHFTVLDAREYQFKSFTAVTRKERDENAAKLFRSLGQVLHLVQDMAQPQHTRNDAHAGCKYATGISGERSWYESYIDARAKDATPPLNFSGYSPPSISQYRDLWTKGGKGLADFSSGNFFSAGTNLPSNCAGLPAPLCRPDAYFTLDREITLTGLDGIGMSAKVTLFLGTVHDGATNQDIPNVPLSSRSVLDAALQKINQPGQVFSLNRLNYDAMADLLVPRAVGYSAGLLDYFFRGTLSFEVKVGTGQDSQMGLVVTNTSDEEMEGTFSLYAEDANEKRGDSPEVSTSLTLPPGGKSETVGFTPARSVHKYVLVFQGRLGTEAGAVAGKVKPYDLPPAIPIQQLANFTGDEQVSSGGGQSGYTVSYGASRVQGGTKQRAQGVFFPAYLGKRLRRIELTFDIPPDPAKNEVVLKLNGTAVGTAWSRETQPEIEPQSWEVAVNVPALGDYIQDTSWPYSLRYHPRLPRYIVAEAESGEQLTMPFLWWRDAEMSRGHALTCQPCIGMPVEQEDEISWRISVEVEFGDGRDGNDGNLPLSNPHTAVGFIPLTGIAGYPVGSYEDDMFFPPTCSVGSYSLKKIYMFAIGGVWQKNRADVIVDEGENTAKGPSECSLAPLPAETAPPVPALQFQRDYTDRERARLQQLGLETPAGHVINLN